MAEKVASPSEQQYTGRETRWSHLAVGAVCFALSLGLLAWLVVSLPPLLPQERSAIRIPPSSLQDMQALARIGSRYTKDYYFK